jgi:hypothetical protein
MAASGKVAMAAGADSEPETVTSAMIAAGISQLPPMDMDARRADRASDECLPGDQLSRKVYLSSGALELERHINLGAIGLYFSLGVQLHIEFDDLCDAEFSERFCGLLDRVGGGLFPGFVAGTDQFNDLVDALRHFVLPFGMKLPAAVQPSITISGAVQDTRDLKLGQ